MIIRKNLAKEGYSKIDNKVITNASLNDGAIRLYCYLASLKNGQNYVDNYIMKAMKITKPTLHKRKRELKAHDLILIDKIDMKTYVVYVGSSKYPASKVKAHWEELDKG